MGQSGSDVAKDASDIVLSDDNFASILNAVEEGRRMFDNVQKFILHVLSQNLAQALILLVGLVFKDNSPEKLSVFPLSPVEIVWLVMITSGLPDMGLGFEQAAEGIMVKKPRSVSFVPANILLKLRNAEITLSSSAQTWCLHTRNYARYARLRHLGGGALLGCLLPRYLRLR